MTIPDPAAIAYKRGYSRGYNTGSRGRWPDHRHPFPPDEIVARIIRTARSLRDAVDSQLATFGPDDEVTQKLGPLIDAFDQTMFSVTKWLKGEDDAS